MAFLLLTFIVLFACTKSQEGNRQEKMNNDATKNEGVQIDKEASKSSHTIFYISDSTYYSLEFLAGLKKTHPYKTVSLNQDSIIINNDQKSIILFPQDLPLNNNVSYQKLEEEKLYSLKLKRINYSSVEYDYKEKVGSEIRSSFTGVAHLRGNFYTGSAGFIEDKNNNTYGTYEYISNFDTCQISIHIGKGYIQKSFFTYYCDSSNNMDSPILLKL
ncbi:hypothetical protein [Bernardetia sp.]|uniref:hypothetical protein n=1 Tax=Bernardetia sp. TaxID=1937974 RepID=UPI0025BA16C4|nr:hypothetical protein [Bernardetia sp.]